MYQRYKQRDAQTHSHTHKPKQKFLYSKLIRLSVWVYICELLLLFFLRKLLFRFYFIWFFFRPYTFHLSSLSFANCLRIVRIIYRVKHKAYFAIISRWENKTIEKGERERDRVCTEGAEKRQIFRSMVWFGLDHKCVCMHEIKENAAVGPKYTHSSNKEQLTGKVFAYQKFRSSKSFSNKLLWLIRAERNVQMFHGIERGTSHKRG